MFRLVWITSINLAGFFRRWMPTNVLLDKFRTRRGLKYGGLTMFIAIPYLYAASTLTVVIDKGGPGWIHLLVILFIWNALKFLINGPVSVALLATAWVRETRRTQAMSVAGEMIHTVR